MAYRSVIYDYPLIRHSNILYIILKHLSYYIYNIYTRMRARICARIYTLTYIRIQYKYELSNCFVSVEALTIKQLTKLAVQSKTRLYLHQRICRNAPERQTAEYLRILCQNVESMYRSILFNVILCNIGYK